MRCWPIQPGTRMPQSRVALSGLRILIDLSNCAPSKYPLDFGTINDRLVNVLKEQSMNRRPSEVLRQNRDLIRSVALLHRTENLRVFGSIVRGEDTEASDLDLLVDPLPGATLLDLGAIQIELQESLGISVDVLTPGDLPKKFRDQVLREAVPV